MNVKNKKCIRTLSFKTLMASKKRNIIAVLAIALTTLLFTSLFTIVLSLNASYQEYQFRQLGGYSHGAFKEVTQDEIEMINAHPKVNAIGARTVIGLCYTDAFAKVTGEVSYMDANCTKWSYATPTTGRMPESGREIAMDTGALHLLGIEPELGAQVKLTYQVNDRMQSGSEFTDTFTLVGFWDYDILIPAHYLNISEEYAKEIEAQMTAEGMNAFRTDLHVMLPSSINIKGQLEQIRADLGLDDTRLGISWAYTASNMTGDLSTVVAVAAFLILVIFTGYLVIYNIFQISVTGDIRFYGLLKTIGVTPRQLRRIIRYQALFLCAAGIPLGLAAGFILGASLMPTVLSTSNLGTGVLKISASSIIFLGASLFSIITVLMSCNRPGRLAAKVSPVEAAKYIEVTRKKRRTTRGARPCNMAFANMSRNKKKTAVTTISLALAVVLLNVLVSFVNGFDMEKYLSSMTCADFLISTADYFHYRRALEYIPEDVIGQIQDQTHQSLGGSGYTVVGAKQMLMDETAWLKEAERFYRGIDISEYLSRQERRGDAVLAETMLEGFDEALLSKLVVFEGSIEPLTDDKQHAIALKVPMDNYSFVSNVENYPAIGETVTIVYTDEYSYLDTRTGKEADESTPQEYLKWYAKERHEVDYTVCAYVGVPHAMSFRYSQFGYAGILSVDALRQDSNQTVVPLFYLFDIPDEAAEQEAEAFLAELTAGDLNPLMYESKGTARSEFENFQRLFLLMGSVLCAIIGLVGILNFLNAMITAIIARQKEFAVLQAVGMTGKQLKSMLVYEGLFYSMGSALIAMILTMVLNPLASSVFEDAFWFFSENNTLIPVLTAFPIFAAFGWMIPVIVYRQTAKKSIVGRLLDVSD